jgi:hypothetical protein
MVHDTMPFVLHLISPPTPDTETLHLLTIPGRKSCPELVKHLEEQLSIAIGFESELNASERPIELATMQVTVTSLMLIAIFLLICLPDSLLSFREYLL